MTNHLLLLSDVDFTIFSEMKLSEISCWEHVEMQAAICGIEINSSLIKFLAGMSFQYENVLKSLIDAITHNLILRYFKSDVEMVEVFYKMLDNKTLESRQLMNAIYAYENSTNDKIDQYSWWYNQDILSLNKWKSQIFIELNNYYPLALVKFYDKWKIELHHFDKAFVRFIFKLLSKYANDVKFKPIYECLTNTYQWQNTLSMYLD